jgi:hypothetical protein
VLLFNNKQSLSHFKEFGPAHRRPQNYKEIFNHRHAILKNHDEKVLGVLKKRCKGFGYLKEATKR